MRSVLLVALASCAPSVMAPTTWRPDPPSAPCEVAETYTDATGTDRRISKYTADGRLVFAQTRLTYDGRGFDHVTWADGRVVRVESFYENAFSHGACDGEGGSDEPASRTVETRAFRYDAAGALTSVAVRKQTFRQRDTTWVLLDDDSSERRYVYRDRKLVAIEGGKGETFEWKDNHPIARRFEGRTSTYEWRGNHLATYRWFDYVQSFEHDAAGRLVRETIATPRASADSPTITEWTYDPAGRLISAVKKTPTSERPTTWTYDAQGRVTSVAQDGRVDRTYEYGPACPANLRLVHPPTATQHANLAVCIGSAGFHHCLD